MGELHRTSEPAQSLCYGLSCELKEQDFATAVTLVSEALKADGFGVLTDVHVQAMMMTKLGVEGRPYRILGACNPSMVHQAPQLPCNLVVCAEADGRLVVGFMDPMAVLQMMGNAKVAQVAQELRGRVQRVMAALVVPTAKVRG